MICSSDWKTKLMSLFQQQEVMICSSDWKTKLTASCRHELPDVFGRIELRRAWWQGQEGNVGGDLQLVRGVPTRLIEEQEGMRARAYPGGDLLQMQLHGLGVAVGEHEGGADAAFGTDGAEDIG